jgi:hypothetical protein
METLGWLAMGTALALFVALEWTGGGEGRPGIEPLAVTAIRSFFRMPSIRLLAWIYVFLFSCLGYIAWTR